MFASARREGSNGIPWFSFFKADRRVTCFYFYLWDADFGPFVHQVLRLLPVHRQAVPQRPRVGQTPGRQGRDRVHRAGQRVRRRARSRRAAGHLRPARARAPSTRCCARLVSLLPHPFTEHDRAAGYRYELSILQAEVSLHPGASTARAGRVVLRSTVARQPRHRPPRPGRA